MWKKTILISGDDLSENTLFGLIGGIVVLLSAFFYLPGHKAISILLGVPQYKEKGLEMMVQGAIVYSLIAFIACYVMMKAKRASRDAGNSNLSDPQN